MTYSLHVKNGDLSFSGPGGFATVTGTQKLVQDLKNWLLEPRGTDPLHPNYGSTLDGGLNPDGTYVGTNIGSVIDRERLIEIESEIRRILAAYQQQQLTRLQAETTNLSGKTTLTPSEILSSVDRVDVEQFSDVIVVRISISTQSGNSLTFSQPVS